MCACSETGNFHLRRLLQLPLLEHLNLRGCENLSRVPGEPGKSFLQTFEFLNTGQANLSFLYCIKDTIVLEEGLEVSEGV